MSKEKVGATITDVANKAGVSVATVSRVFNNNGIVKGNTSKKVLEAAQLLNYRHQRTKEAPVLDRRRLLIIHVPSISNPFYNEIVDGARTIAVQQKYDLLLNQGQINESTIQHLLELIKSVKCQGIITLNTLAPRELKMLSRAVPLVQCCEYEDNAPVPTVGIDDYSAAQNVMSYLFSLGKRKIGFVNGPKEYKYARLRKKGYIEAMEKAGYTIEPHWIIQLPEINADIAYSSVINMLSIPNPPDAFFAVSDLCAAAIIRAARYHSLSVPEEISIVGFDNIDISSITSPSITTVSQPKFQLGFTACDLLIGKIENPNNENRHIVLETELIVRESTAYGQSL